jgi:hypothetical protein
MQFSEVFPDDRIVVSLIRQLSWSHLRIIMFIDEKIKREFYIEICKIVFVIKTKISIPFSIYSQILFG